MVGVGKTGRTVNGCKVGAFAICVAMLAAACNTQTTVVDSTTSSQAASDLPAAGPDGLSAGGAGVEPELSKQALLAELGAPDSFSIELALAEAGEVVQLESWLYHDAATQIDLIDGVILWKIDIEPLEDGAFLPFLYDPTEFTMGQSVQAVRELLDPIPVTELGTGDELGYEGAVLYGAEQLLLGFAEDQLLYVETFPLVPGDLGS